MRRLGLLLLLVTAVPAAAQRAPAVRLSRGEQACQDAIAEPDAAQERAAAQRVRREALRAGDARAAACARYAEAHAATRAGAPDVDALLDAAETEARRAGDVWTLTSAVARKAVVANNAGAPVRADSLIRRALAIAAATPGLAGREAALSPVNILAHQQLDEGDPQAADATFARLIREARALDVGRYVGIGSYGRGTIAFDRSDLDAATRFFRDAESVARTEPPVIWHQALVGSLARLDAVMGRVDVAAGRLDSLARAQAAEAQPGAAAITLEQLGGIFYDARRYREAVGAYRRAHDAVAGTGLGRARHKFRLLEARAWFAAGQPDAARRALHPSADSVASAPLDPAEEALALLLLARDARLDGRLAEAAAFATRSARVARRIGFDGNWADALDEEALAREALGDFRGALGATRRADSLAGRERAVALAQAASRVEAEKAARTAQTAEAERRRRLLWGWGVTLAGAAAAAIAAGVYIRTVRRKNAEITRQATALTEANADLAATNAAVQAARDQQARFLTNVSHELRTPLALVLGPLDDLREGRFGAPPEAARPVLERAGVHGRRLRRLLDDLLALSRLDAGALPLRRARLDAAAFARSRVAAFGSTAAQAGVALDAPDSRPVWIAADPAHLETIVYNLVANAIKFTPAGGRVRVDVRPGADGGAEIAVVDTGIGIAGSDLERVFERFEQGDTPQARAGEGTGIGLALSREIVTLHGGSIVAESTPGGGTTVRVRLPPGQPDDTADVLDATTAIAHDGDAHDGDAHDGDAHDGLPPQPPDDARPLVLVVEDNADLRAYLHTVLASTCRVEEAPDGAAGLAAAREIVPDLVLSDVMMPGLDGFGLLDALRADVRTSHVPVMLLTARADAESRLAGLRRGADAYLPKPFSAAEVEARVAGLVATRRALRERWSRRAATDATRAEMPSEEVVWLDALRAAAEAGLADAAFGVDALAEAVAMSPRQLARKLHALTDETPGALLRRLRMARAAEMLRARRSVGEVAEAVGFGSRSQFSRAFREAHGAAPSDYAARAADGAL